MSCKLDIRNAIVEDVYITIQSEMIDGRYTYSMVKNDTIKINSKRDNPLSRTASREQAYKIAKDISSRIKTEYNGYVTGLINEPNDYDPITIKIEVSQKYIDAEYDKLPVGQKTDPKDTTTPFQEDEYLSDEMLKAQDVYDITFDQTIRNLQSMPFKFSINKIIAGSKTITVRDRAYRIGSYKDIPSGKIFNVYSKGNMFLKDYLAIEGLKKDEFTKKFLGQEEVKKEHIQDFLDNKIPLEIYQIQLVDSLDDLIPDIADERFQKAYTTKQSLLTHLKSSLRREVNSSKKDILRERIQHLQDQMDILSDDTKTSFKALTDMMAADLNVVKAITSAYSDRASIDFSLGLIRNYNSLIISNFKDNMEILTDAEKANITKTLFDINQLIEDIQAKRIQIGANLVKNRTNRNVLDVNGVVVATGDISDIATYTLDTTDITDPIVQSITKDIKNAMSRLNLSYNGFNAEHKKVLTELQKTQKANGIKKKDYFNYMIEVDAKGKRTGNHVSQYTNAYYDKKYDTSSSKPKDKLSFLASEHNISFSESSWNEKVKQYRDWFERERASSIVLSDSQIANGVTVEEAVDREFNNWLRSRDARTMYNILKRLNTKPESISNIDIEFFQSFDASKGFFKVKIGENWEDVITLKPKDKYVSDQWTAIQLMEDTDPRKSFYKHYIKNIIDTKRKLQDTDFWTDWNYIPEKMKQAEGILDKMRDYRVNAVAQSISKNSDTIDPFTGELTLSIPTYMTGNTLKPDEKDYDLGNVLELFVKEGMRYEEMSDIEDDVNYMLDLLKSKKVYLTNADGTPKIVNGEIQYKNDISNLVKAARYRVEAQVYEQRQNIEGKSKIKLANSAVKNRQRELKKAMNDLNLTEDEKAIALPYIKSGLPYSGNETNIKQFVTLGIEYQSMEPLLKTVTGSKIVNTTIVYTALKFLGLNLFAGFAEIMQGISSFSIEAASKRNFNDKEGWAAMGEVISAMTPWGSGNKSKVRNFGKVFGTETEIIHGEAKKSWLTEAVFAHYRAANHLINNSFMIAMLKAEKITDKTGKEHSFWDIAIIDDKGIISLPDTFDNPFYDNGVPSQHFLDLLHKYREVMKNNRDRQTGEDPILLEKYAAGRALGQFKKNWMIRGFTTRFGNYKDANLFLGQDTKGFYRSWWELFKVPLKENVLGEQTKDYSAVGLGKALISGITNTYKYSLLGKMFGAKPDGNLQEVDVANIRKFMREMTIISTFMIIGLILASLGGDGDDEKKRKGFVRWAINQNIRFMRDMQTYMSPESFASIVKNPAPLVSSVVDFTTLLDKIVESTILLDPYNKKGQLKVWKASKELVPVLRQIEALEKKFDKTVSYRQ